MLEFESPERAREWYHSADCAPVKALRLKASKTQVVLLTGHDADPAQRSLETSHSLIEGNGLTISRFA